MKKSRLEIASFIIMLLSICAANCFSQEMTKLCNLTPRELKAKYSAMAKDPAIKNLRQELSSAGFIKIAHDAGSFGFTGNFTDSGKKTVPVEFYAYDFY